MYYTSLQLPHVCTTPHYSCHMYVLHLTTVATCMYYTSLQLPHVCTTPHYSCHLYVLHLTTVDLMHRLERGEKMAGMTNACPTHCCSPQSHIFWSLVIFPGHSTPEDGLIGCDDESGEIFDLKGQHVKTTRKVH